MAEVAIFWDSIYNVARRVNVCSDFSRVGIATGHINLPHCYFTIIVTEHICIFIDCMYIEIVAEHTSQIYWDRVNIATGGMYIFLNFSGIETATGRIGLYF